MQKTGFLEFLLIFGGIFEIVIGIILLFIDLVIGLINLETISTFSQMAGSFLIGYGILLIISSKDIERYKLIPLINILIRVIMVVFTLFNIIKYPQFLPITVFALIYDPIWSVCVLLLLKK